MVKKWECMVKKALAGDPSPVMRSKRDSCSLEGFLQHRQSK